MTSNMILSNKKNPVITIMYFTFFNMHYVKAKTAIHEFTLLVVYLLSFNYQ